MKIGKREIGPDQPPYIIAELSGNHNGTIDNVYKLIDAAIKAGADAVKLQTYTPDTMTLDCANEDFMVKSGTWAGRSLYDLYQEAHTPYSWHPAIFDYCHERKIEVFSSVFDDTAIKLLEGLDCPAYKIASFELTDIPLVKSVAATGKPTIISVGMASHDEILQSVREFAKVAGDTSRLALLHCVSAYPATASQANLPALGPLSEILGKKHVVGLSDHTLGCGVSAAGVAFGACLVEKHLTLDRSAGGPDSSFSLEPREFKMMVNACHDAWQATRPSSSPSQNENKKFRRSIYVVKPISSGERLTKENVRVIRPAFGLMPKFYQMVLGQAAVRDLPAGHPLDWSDLLASDE